MASGRVDAVVVGADRIATNGDAANKIGTFTHAVSAHNAESLFMSPLPLQPLTQKHQMVKT